MNTSFYWHLSLWANAGHNISTVTITNKKCRRPWNQNYSNGSSCIKQFESLTRCTSILALIFLHLESQVQNLTWRLWTTHYCKTHWPFFDYEVWKYLFSPSSTFPLSFFLFIKLINYFHSSDDWFSLPSHFLECQKL